MPENKTEWEIMYEPHALDYPVLQAMDDSPEVKPARYHSLHSAIGSLSIRAGYREPVTSHSIRRGVANKIYSQFKCPLT